MRSIFGLFTVDVSLFCVKLPTSGNYYYNNNVYVTSIKKTKQHVPGLPMEKHCEFSGIFDIVFYQKSDSW